MKGRIEAVSPTVLLRGSIRNLRRTRTTQDFFFTESDRTKMGAAAVAAGLAGLGGIATGLGAMAMDTTEEADLLEFELEGRTVVAWVWVSVFNEGDEVEVVAEELDGRWHGYGIRRPSDGIVALHPHCSRGRYAHYKKSIVLFFKIFGIYLACFSTMGLTVMVFKSASPHAWLNLIPVAGWGTLTLGVIFGVVAFRIARKFMGFVRLAEAIFTCFGWKDVKNIDLPALTKRTKGPNDPGPLGVLYFRYQP